MSIELECEYCERKGEYPEKMMFKDLPETKWQRARTITVCRDPESCDKEWFKNHPEEED